MVMSREKSNALLKIMALEFQVQEFTLYLDTHPNDNDAVCLHNQYVEELCAATNAYTEQFGPFTQECPADCPWNWIDDPWPWDMTFNVGGAN